MEAIEFKEKIFFYSCPLGSPDNTPYHHWTVSLAEGFQQLGIPFFSNINYWKTSPEKEDYLFHFDPEITPDDCSIVILDCQWPDYSGSFLPENLFHPRRKYVTVYLDCSDGIKTYSWNSEFKQFDFIFRTHCNDRLPFPSSCYPLAFGLSNRILQELNSVPPISERQRSILFNFRVNHSLRKIARNKFSAAFQHMLYIDDSVDDFNSSALEPYHYLMWHQTGRRHYPGYYDRLKKTVACAAFGGGILPSYPYEPIIGTKIWHRALNKLALYSGRIFQKDFGRIYQWDSWRFWESLAAGCVTFHVDFEKYKLRLPVMPENWRHYIGVDLDNVQKSADRIMDEPQILERISNEGRQWAIEFYSPLPTAIRFLKTISR
jgi:hypothetical protein